MLCRMNRIVNNLAFIPSDLQEMIRQRQGGLFNDSWLSERPLAGTAATYDEIRDVVDKSIECKALSASEASWNCGVHFPLGEMAVRQSGLDKSVRVSNNTSARIAAPTDLLPLVPHTLSVNSRMVDLAISLRPSPAMSEAFRYTRPVGSIINWNQTHQSELLHTPIAVNIVTKVASEGHDKNSAQLATWILAQYARLRILILDAGHDYDSIDKPMLPFWVVQGPTWSFGAAKMGNDGRMTVWHCGPIGESSDYTGVCQILAALDTTITWAQYEYRP